MFKLLSPSKINLFLIVTGKMKSGRHSLFSLITAVNLFDEILIEESKQLEIVTNNTNIATEDNIIWKVFILLNKQYNIKEEFKITINKNIPIGGGLGGGSSNAATIMNFINNYYKLRIDREKMIELASEIGDDVPFFLDNRVKIIYHQNDKQNNLSVNIPKLHILLVKPQENIITKDIYDSYRVNGQYHPLNQLEIDSILQQEDINLEQLIKIISVYQNDLLEHSLRKVPKIGDIISEVSNCKNCLFANMSGSGSVCFGLFSDEESAKKAKEKLCEKWWCVNATNMVAGKGLEPPTQGL